MTLGGKLYRCIEHFLIMIRESELTGLFRKAIAWRRHLHQYPELSLEEYRTSEYIRSQVGHYFDELRTGFAGPALLGLIYPPDKTYKRTVILRADMDALPIDEPQSKPYSSKVPGVMHACGHDLHMATLMGLAELYGEHRDLLRELRLGFLFQPGEEGGFGAKLILDSGVLQELRPDAIIGMHVWGELELGKIGIARGFMMASFDEFDITLRGPGGHAAAPNSTRDLIYIAKHLIDGLYVIAREFDPVIPHVLTLGYIKGGSARNVIPSEVKLGGTMRTFSQRDRELFRKRIDDLVKSIASLYRVKIELNFIKGYPALNNDQRLCELLEGVVQDLNLELVEHRSLGAEDFAYYVQVAPILYFIVGAAGSKRTLHHSPDFDPDERAIIIGIKVFRELIARLDRY